MVTKQLDNMLLFPATVGGFDLAALKKTIVKAKPKAPPGAAGASGGATSFVTSGFDY